MNACMYVCMSEYKLGLVGLGRGMHSTSPHIYNLMLLIMLCSSFRCTVLFGMSNTPPSSPAWFYFLKNVIALKSNSMSQCFESSKC